MIGERGHAAAPGAGSEYPGRPRPRALAASVTATAGDKCTISRRGAEAKADSPKGASRSEAPGPRRAPGNTEQSPASSNQVGDQKSANVTALTARPTSSACRTAVSPPASS